MWVLIPAAGSGTRIQPLACSKELLPVGSWDPGVVERTRATREYLAERMIQAVADRLCFIISPYRAQGGRARAVPAGTACVDVGTLAGYHDAIRLLRSRAEASRAHLVTVHDTDESERKKE